MVTGEKEKSTTIELISKFLCKLSFLFGKQKFKTLLTAQPKNIPATTKVETYFESYIICSYPIPFVFVLPTHAS